MMPQNNNSQSVDVELGLVTVKSTLMFTYLAQFDALPNKHPFKFTRMFFNLQEFITKRVLSTIKATLVLITAQNWHLLKLAPGPKILFLGKSQLSVNRSQSRFEVEDGYYPFRYEFQYDPTSGSDFRSKTNPGEYRGSDIACHSSVAQPCTCTCIPTRTSTEYGTERSITAPAVHYTCYSRAGSESKAASNLCAYNHDIQPCITGVEHP